MTKPSSQLRYDYALLLDAAVGDAGIPKMELPKIFRRLEQVRDRLKRQHADGNVGFLRVPESRAEVNAALAMAKEVQRDFKRLIVVGIGGSDLGARTLIKALGPARGCSVSFIGANTDPEEIGELLAGIDWRQTALNVVSKSGDTVEPLATFLLLRQKLIAAVGEKRHTRHVIVTTDAKSGTLRHLADREGYRSLAATPDVGGRFSVLTATGLFPAACAGLPVRRLVAGAAQVLADLARLPVERQPALLLAGLHHYAYAQRGCKLTVLMPYAEGLRGFADWFRQLWAESLGKRLDRFGRVVEHGLTPVVGLGATDQHSQIQLFNEGPNDKLITFIEVERFRRDFRVPGGFADLPGVAYLAGQRFSDVIHAERQATATSLAAAGRPNGTIFLPSLSPESLGALLFTWQLTTAALAELLEIDAYDQPGVEAGKQAMFALLGRPGYARARRKSTPAKR